MAKGSHKIWRGWETRICWVCHTRVVLARGTALHCQPVSGTPFSLCNDHLDRYHEAFQANAPDREEERPHEHHAG